MRIAFFSIAHPSYGGGFEQQIRKTALELHKKKHTITLITLSKSATHKLAIFLSILYFHPRFSFPEIRNHPVTQKDIKLRTFSSINELKKILKQQDIIYAKNEFIDAFILFFTKSNMMPPIICGVHTVLQYATAKEIHSKVHNLFYSSFIYKKSLEVFSAYHCINLYQVDFLKKIITNKPIFYIPNFIDTVKTTIKPKTKTFDILYVGRLTEQKGIDILIATIEQLSKLKIFKNTVITICGAGEFDKQIKELTKQYKNVIYKGFISSEKLKTIYKNSDILFFPSRGESFPLTILEAQNFGMIVVAFDIAGVRDAIKNGKNGFLLKSENIKHIVNRLIMLYNLQRTNSSEFLTLKRNSQERIRKNYSTKIVMAEYEKMFRKLV